MEIDHVETWISWIYTAARGDYNLVKRGRGP